MKERETPHPAGSSRKSQGPSRLLTVGLALLALSALYLLGPARNVMGWEAACAILLHLGLGLVLIVPVVLYAVHAKGSRPAERVHPFSAAFGVCALTGLILTGRAANGVSTAHDRGLWWTHLLAGFLAVLVFGGRAAWGRGRLHGQDTKPIPAVAVLPASAAGTLHHSLRFSFPRLPLRSSLLLTLLGLSTLGLGGSVLAPHYDAGLYYRDTTATNAAQAENPFFPAGLRLTAESRHDAPAGSYCGRAGCHTTALSEWQGSVHQQAATDPVYRRVRGEYIAHNGETAARWCAGCHEPLSVVQADKQALSRTGPAAQEGVGCVGCHAMTDVAARTGNGRFTLSLPQNYPFADSQAGWKRRMHDFLLRVRPAPHQTAYLKPEIHAAPELCGTCHRQSFNVPQNGYQFVHAADEWGAWQSGPFSGRTARTAGLTTGTQRTCQDCHSRRADGKFSHASTTSSWMRPPSASHSAERGTRKEEPGRQQGVCLDIFALRRIAGAGQTEDWIAPLDAPPVGSALRAGETYLLDIVVSNRHTGHEFPAGYLDIEEAWLEVTLEDGRGRVTAESGRIMTDAASLPPDTHAYRSIPLDRNGNPLTHHELWRQVTTAYRRAIPSGGADIARYRFTLPRAFTPPLTVHARLRYRSLRPDFAAWVDPRTASPATTLAEEKVVMRSTAAKGPRQPETETALRYVAYGLGLLAPKDAPDAARARKAFRIAQQLSPNRPEPFLGLGRAYLAEPELLAARAQFNIALRLDPENPAAQADLGLIYSRQGEYDRALTLLRPLVLRFPQDGALQFDLGLTLFRSGDYRAAIDAFQSSLAADPDNAAAHFQLKQCFQHLQRVPDARREEAIGQYLAEDHLASVLVPPYLRAHPDIRQSAQPIPEHRLLPRHD